MNSTTSTTALALGVPSEGLQSTLGGSFFGFTLGSILFGITIRQAYQYYTTNLTDTVFRKSLIAIVFMLDLLNFLFGLYMVYSLILQLVGYSDMAPKVLWSLKALAAVQVLLIVVVQFFYLSQIWRLSKNLLLLPRKFTRVVQFFVVFAGLYALAIGTFFIQQLRKITSVIGFSPQIESVIYIGFGSTAFLDCGIAAAMCLILYKSNGGTRKTESVVETLIQYFISTGLLTSFAAIMCIALYVVQPTSLLFLGMEFSMTRLYANSLLAMFNARRQLRAKMEESIEPTIPPNVIFGQPESMSPKPLFSGSAETKYSEYAFPTRGRKDKDPRATRNYTV